MGTVQRIPDGRCRGRCHRRRLNSSERSANAALNIAAIATRAVLRHLAGKPVPKEIMVPAALIDRANINRWKVPMAERRCPAWDEIVR